ncbi:MAG: isoprenoid biosynthesis glyoxalase ElbB [Alphaproteobacteria bacterium]|nr:isoprenoid biosynthesis glyoxalase ElbB [Alphaproteobacteria bacterium]
MTNVAVVLSGCGHLDGAEIRESVLTLLYLDQRGAEVQCFAPDVPQKHVVNHLTGEEAVEQRNVLAEAARIARGNIKPLSEAKADDFDALIIPGGFGVAKNLSDLAFTGPKATVLPEFKALIEAFLEQKKPIGAICIAPAVLTAAVGQICKPLVTIGEDKATADAIQALGGTHQSAPSDACVSDEKNRIVTCSAYMRNDRLASIAKGIERVVEKVLNMAQAARKAA